MAELVTDENTFDTVEITGSAGRWLLARDHLIFVDTGPGLFEDQNHADNAISIEGRIISLAGYGIDSAGASTDFTIKATGVVVGNLAAIRTGGANESITNSGSIDGRTEAIHSDGESLLVDNRGQIGGETAIAFATHGGDVINRQNGIISGVTAISAATSAGEKLQTVNHGTISGSLLAYSSSLDGIDIIVNYGTIKGNIALGAGDDSFRDMGGRVSGTIAGGTGSDTYVITSQALNIVEEIADLGTDTVRASISYTLVKGLEALTLTGSADLDGNGNGLNNILTGNRGDNSLSGFNGTDTIAGAGGDDRLTGGGSADLFVFATGDDRDTITDFNTKVDHIDLSNLAGIDSFADLKENHLRISGDDVLIVNGGDTLVLQNVDAADLTRENFDF